MAEGVQAGEVAVIALAGEVGADHERAGAAEAAQRHDARVEQRDADAGAVGGAAVTPVAVRTTSLDAAADGRAGSRPG